MFSLNSLGMKKTSLLVFFSFKENHILLERNNYYLQIYKQFYKECHGWAMQSLG